MWKTHSDQLTDKMLTESEKTGLLITSYAAVLTNTRNTDGRQHQTNHDTSLVF